MTEYRVYDDSRREGGSSPPAGSPWPQIEKLAVKFHGVEIMPSETPSEPDAILEIVGRFNADRISEAHDAADCLERAVNQILEANK